MTVTPCPALRHATADCFHTTYQCIPAVSSLFVRYTCFVHRCRFQERRQTKVVLDRVHLVRHPLPSIRNGRNFSPCLHEQHCRVPGRDAHLCAVPDPLVPYMAGLCRLHAPRPTLERQHLGLHRRQFQFHLCAQEDAQLVDGNLLDFDILPCGRSGGRIPVSHRGAHALVSF